MGGTILFIILMTLLSVEWTTQSHKPRVKVQCIKVIITNLNLWALISTCTSHHCFPHISCGTCWDTLCLSTKAFFLSLLTISFILMTGMFGQVWSRSIVRKNKCFIVILSKHYLFFVLIYYIVKLNFFFFYLVIKLVLLLLWLLGLNGLRLYLTLFNPRG